MPRWLDTDLLQDTLLVQWHPRLPLLLTATSTNLILFSSSGERVSTIPFPISSSSSSPSSSSSTITSFLPTSLSWHAFRQLFVCGFSNGSMVVWMNGKTISLASSSSSSSTGSPHTDPILHLAWANPSSPSNSNSDLYWISLDSSGWMWVWQLHLSSFQFTKLHEFRSPEPPLQLMAHEPIMSLNSSSSSSLHTTTKSSNNTNESTCIPSLQHDWTLVTPHHLIGLNASQPSSEILFHVTSSTILRVLHQFHSTTFFYLVVCDNGQLHCLSMLNGRIASSQQLKLGILGVTKTAVTSSSSFLSVTWVGQRMAAIANGVSNTLRIVDLLGDDSTSMTIDNEAKGRITTLSYDEIRNRLAAGTDTGHIIIWQSKAQYLKDENRIGRIWQLQSSLCVNAPLSQLSFHSFYAFLLALRQGQLRLFLEQSEVVAFNETICALQTSFTTLQLIDWTNNKDTKEIKVSPNLSISSTISIQKLTLSPTHLLIWNTKFAQRYALKTQQWDPPLSHSADQMYLFDDQWICIHSHQVTTSRFPSAPTSMSTLTTATTTTTSSSSFTSPPSALSPSLSNVIALMEESQGMIVHSSFEAPFLTWMTKEGGLYLYDCSQHQLLVNGKKRVSHSTATTLTTISSSSSFSHGYILDLAIQPKGKCIALIAKTTDAMFHSKVWLYFWESDTWVNGAENEQVSHDVRCA